MPDLKLYDIPIEFAALEQKLIESEGELTPELEKEFDTLLRSGTDKIEAAAGVLRSLDLEQQFLDTEIKRLQDRKTSIGKNADRLKSLVLTAVDSAFGGKVKTPRFTVWGQTSAQQLSVDVAPGVNLEVYRASDFVRTKYELNKDALKDFVKKAEQDAALEIPNWVTVEVRPGTRYLRVK